MSDKDNNALRSDYRGDPEMAELIELFVSELPDRVRNLQQCFASGDAEGLKRIAHQLRGASGGYGFDPVGHRAHDLESALQTNADPDTIRRRLDELVDLCSRVAA